MLLDQLLRNVVNGHQFSAGLGDWTTSTNALAHLPYRRVVLTRDDSNFYEVSVNDRSTVTLQPWTTGRSIVDEAESQGF